MFGVDWLPSVEELGPLMIGRQNGDASDSGGGGLPSIANGSWDASATPYNVSSQARAHGCVCQRRILWVEIENEVT